MVSGFSAVIRILDLVKIVRRDTMKASASKRGEYFGCFNVARFFLKRKLKRRQKSKAIKMIMNGLAKSRLLI